jgi:hypothetical protein
MDCRTAQQLLPFQHTADELAPVEAQALDAHLADCSSCATVARVEKQLDAYLGQAMRDVAVPAGLRERLLSRLDQQQAAGNRLTLYRGLVAVAACLVIAIGSYSLATTLRPKDRPLNFSRIAGGLSSACTAAQVEDWLDFRMGSSALYLPKELSEGWNFNLLAHIYVQHVQGHDIPTLVFQNENARATVYLVRSGEYDPVTDDPQPPGSPWKLGGNGYDEYTAVVVTERGDWTAFQNRK